MSRIELQSFLVVELQFRCEEWFEFHISQLTLAGFLLETTDCINPENCCLFCILLVGRNASLHAPSWKIVLTVHDQLNELSA